MSTFLKDPSSVLDYEFGWSQWLATGETIDTHTITADDGITVASSSAAADTVTVWLSGGTAGTKYRVTCRIVTTDGRTDERSMWIKAQDR